MGDRLRYYDLDAGLTLEAWMSQQRRRIGRIRQTTGGLESWTLTIRGHRPAQILLDEPPVEIQLRAGEVGKRVINS